MDYEEKEKFDYVVDGNQSVDKLVAAIVRQIQIDGI